jgi:hypothetical protein
VTRPPEWRPPPERRVEVMRAQLDVGVDAFRCFYCGVVMVEGDSWRTPEWEHRSPGDGLSVVLATKLINRMKTDMSEPQFREMVRALADHFAGAPFDERAWPHRAPDETRSPKLSIARKKGSSGKQRRVTARRSC